MSAISRPSSPVAPWGWLAALAATTFLSLGAYTCSQQVLRCAADDPQVQLAQDAAAQLAAGAAPADVVPAGHVDVARSLAPWLAVADAGAGALAANGLLDGRAPLPPRGVLEFALRAGEHRVTWRPAQGPRLALAVVAVPGHAGWVAYSGRSLRECTMRIDRIGHLMLLAWSAAMGVVLAAWGLTARSRRGESA